MLPVVAVTKNAQHKPERLIGPSDLIKARELEILFANSEAHRFAIDFHRQSERKRVLR
jgi:excinuclease UvrABC nuclease subunit